MGDNFQHVDRLTELALGGAAPQHERQQAEQELMKLQDPSNIAVLRYSLEMSTSPYTHFFAAKTLQNICTEHWNAISEQRQHAELRQWLISFVGQKGAQLQKFVLTAIVGVLTRVTKLGWLDTIQFQDLPSETHRCFICSPDKDMPVIGLLLLNSLVTEMTTVNTKMTLSQHRKTVVAFRDACLFEIFRVSLNALERVRVEHQTIDARYTEQAVALALACLTFDFVGIFKDESTDDVGTVQIPNGWKNLLIEPKTMTLFWDVYTLLPAPRSTDILKCIVQFASVRRSLFNDDAERSRWLNHILQGVLHILRGSLGLSDQGNYHEFCRLLSRIKPNYQLSELVSAEYYEEWITLTAKFTIDSFVHWERSANCSYFLLGLWARLLSAQPYLKGDKPSKLEDFAPNVVEAYITSRLELARAAMQNQQIENALEDQDMLLVQLESLPVLARAIYDKVGPFLCRLAAPELQQMQDAVARVGGQGIPPGQEQNVLTSFSIMDARLSWLVYMMGSITSHHTTVGSSDPQAEALDGEVTALVLQLAQLIGVRLSIPNQHQMVTLQRLQSAVLYFLNGFRKVYIGESTIPCSKVYPRLKELIGLEDNMGVLRVIVELILNNLKAWRECPRIISETLSLFYDLSSGYSSGRLVLKLEMVKMLLQQHTHPTFDFVNVPANSKQRTKFYKTLANLLFLETSSEGPFECFMRPLQERGMQLSAMTDPAQFLQPEVKAAIIGWLRDIRGICASCVNKRTYTLFFDWVFPFVSAHHNPGTSSLMLRICQAYAGDNSVVVPLLRFYSDLVNNRSQRISFESSSPNGILLFREASALLVAYGQPLLQRLYHYVGTRGTPQSGSQTPPWGTPQAGAAAGPDHGGGSANKYGDIYKGMKLCIDILARALYGGYCNFGVFQLYKDPALDEALETVVKLLLAAPVDDVLSFPKVAASTYYLMEILFSSHTSSLLRLPTASFMQLLHMLEKGITSVELSRQSVVHATGAIGHLCSYYHTQLQKTTSVSGQQPGAACAQHVQMLQQHFAADGGLFSRVLQYIFHIVLYDDSANQWSMSRPMLPLILIDENSFHLFRQTLLNRVSGDRQMRLNETFEKLMDGVDKTLEPKNRDKFTQNITVFRHQAKMIL
eukprot:TRINITY_DN453_c0_g1_i2.p1 TRINITY_DN453_c0_g1~~TRINITY_DN453_c0_g1_i2.p1  ORF type:complete len:1126 (+),score=438.76 TRINITY_DN453_c0_g1_i2:162-3539(+)